MRIASIKTNGTKTKNKTKAVFFYPPMLHSSNVFRYYARIPDLMLCMNRARQILKSRGLPIPVWLWSLMEQREPFNSVIQTRLMSFLVSVGLYERLIRITAAQPDFLVGVSPALCVCARSKTFEKILLNIVSGEDYDQKIVKVYKRKSPTSPYFSLQYFSKMENETFEKWSKKQYFNHYTSVLPVSKREKNRIMKQTIALEEVIERDSLLSWLWPILKRQKMKNIPTKLSDVSFC